MMTDSTLRATEPELGRVAGGTATVVRLRVLLSDRRRHMKALRSAGYTLQEIADEYGLTRQRVWKILATPAARGRRR